MTGALANGVIPGVKSWNQQTFPEELHHFGGGKSTADQDMAQRLHLLILSPLLTSADLLRRCHPKGVRWHCWAWPERILGPCEHQPFLGVSGKAMIWNDVSSYESSPLAPQTVMDKFLSFLHIYSPGLPSHAISAGVTVASASNPPRNSCCCRLWRYWNPAPMAFHGGWCSLVWDALGGAQRSEAYPLGKLWRFHVEFPDGLWMYMVSPPHVSGWSGKCWLGIFLPRLGSHRHIFLSMTDDKIDEHDQIDQMIQMIACEKRNWVQQAQK